MSVVLYQFWRSSASWRVRWALAVKQIPFESVVVDLDKAEQRKPEHLARNPMGRVPVLAIDGRFLSESVAIIEYLDETRPSPRLIPESPIDRARVRQIVETVNAGIQPLQNRSVYAFHAPDDAAAQERWIRHFNERGLEALEGILAITAKELGADGPFAYGDRLTAADLFLVPQVTHARRVGIDVAAKYPRVARAEAAAMATEHARGALPENQPGAPK